VNQPVHREKFNLDIYGKKKHIVADCNNPENRVVIICGYKGCGKSTQVPQFLYEYYQQHRALGSKKHYKMLCTQPRRIACMSIVKRIADEMNINVGDKIGYHISRDLKKS
jgi:pre-mRNA-splicing factor ATP-dependent RNA helicase DHX16